MYLTVLGWRLFLLFLVRGSEAGDDSLLLPSCRLLQLGQKEETYYTLKVSNVQNERETDGTYGRVLEQSERFNFLPQTNYRYS
jgi:hypothetical protein